MQRAKNGYWWDDAPHRALANNSACYTERPDVGIFLSEWTSLFESKSGERGIFNRVAATKQAIHSGRRSTDGHEYGTNPCGEIILRSNGLCNLSEVVVRSTDTIDILRRKVELATIIGTFQSTLTSFRYLRPIWRANAEEERLLGVSLTGIMDSILTAIPDKDLLESLKQHAIDTNKVWAEKLGINQSAAITCVKPSGTVSQLVNSASGIHPRYSRYYIRTVRADKKDPLAVFLKEQGVPCEDDVTKPDKTYVFSFPMESPEHAVLRDDLSAIQQLEHYLVYRKHWTEHNPSITIYVREHEWLDVGAWVFKHFDDIGGVSFLPHSDHVYRQAPYQEIDKATYLKWVESYPKIEWEQFREYEDVTTGQQELACMAGVCEI
jgi:ribonucleoside-diphosphate reductase alpha chain